MPDLDRLQLHPLASSDTHDLLAFESDNRHYFERWVEARPPAYYHSDAVAAAIAKAEQERRDDLAYQYLARYDGHIIGRINLTGIKRPYLNKAQLGYRIGEHSGGRGYATRMVALLLDEAFGKLDLWRLEAAVRPGNPGSIAVMQRNGFQQYGKSEKAMHFQGAWSDLLYFERRSDKLADEQHSLA